MDSCIVCCKLNENIFSRITTVSDEWKEWNIQRIIEKHLWWWHLRPSCSSGSGQWICFQCWHELSSFHSFYVKVEKQHKLYDDVLLSLIKTDKDEEAAVDIKMEEHFDSESVLTENLMPLEAPKRGRRKKTAYKFENVQIEQVKHELGLNGTLEIATPDLSVNMLDNDEVASIDWEHSFLNEGEDITQEKLDGEEVERAPQNLLSIKKTRGKVKSKSKAVTKYRKKYTKSKKKEKKNEVIKESTNSIASQVMKKNDKFIADTQFHLSCGICSAWLGNFNNLKIHFRKEHDTLGYAMCCNKKFYKRGVLVDHLNVHKDPNYFMCLQCNKALSTRRSYEKHMETHQLYEIGENLFTCPKCNKSFLKKPVFERHLFTHVPEEERNFLCGMCDKKFASEYHRKQHCKLTHSKESYKICDICGKLIRDGFSFKRHMGEHNGDTHTKVKCDICGAELATKYRLNHHKKMMHTEENQQKQVCPYCSKVSPNLNAHRHHVEYTHTLERKHACSMCDKKFRRPLELKEHLSTHTGEPLYTCAHCPRTFISGANMHKHRKLVHRKEWEEGRKKKEARALAGKKFLGKADVTPNETLYIEPAIMEPDNDSEPNFFN